MSGAEESSRLVRSMNAAQTVLAIRKGLVGVHDVPIDKISLVDGRFEHVDLSALKGALTQAGRAREADFRRADTARIYRGYMAGAGSGDGGSLGNAT